MRPPAIFFYGGSENLQQNQQPHFLDSCFLCHKQIAHNSDIFMYRGNTPFCSEECRQEQIEIDDANEKRLKKASSSTSSSSKRASSKNRNNPAESSQESNTNKAVRTEAVAVV